MENIRWLIIVFSVGFLAFIVFIIKWAIQYSRKQKEVFANVSMALGALYDKDDWKTQPKMTGIINEREYEVTLHVVSTGQSSVTYLDLKTPTDSSLGHLTVKKASGAGRFFKKIGLNKPLDSGDPYFNKKVMVKGEPEQDILAVLNGGYFKEPAVQLTTRGYSITINKKKENRLVASKVYNFKKDMSEPTIRTDLQSLISLVKAIENKV